MFEQKPIKIPEVNCLTSDLVAGFPPTTSGYELGTTLYAFDSVTKELSMVFTLTGIDGGVLKWFIKQVNQL